MTEIKCILEMMVMLFLAQSKKDFKKNVYGYCNIWLSSGFWFSFLKCSGFVTIINCESTFFIFIGHLYLFIYLFIYFSIISCKSMFFIFVWLINIFWKIKVCDQSKSNIKTLSSNFNLQRDVDWAVKTTDCFQWPYFIFLCKNARITWCCHWNISNNS